MPRSLVLYTTEEALGRLRAETERLYSERPVRPYTLSFSHTTCSGSRVRITELLDGCLGACLDRVRACSPAAFGATPDPDVHEASFEELIEGADRFTRQARLQFLSPTIVTLGGYGVPFPVLPLTFSCYVYAWNAFSPKKIPGTAALFEAIRMVDFRISCVRTSQGPAFQGWIDVEMQEGRAEEEIATFNALCDFAFFSGTGRHTEEGFGQTRRAARRGSEKRKAMSSE